MNTFVVYVMPSSASPVIEPQKPIGILGLPMATVLDRRRHQFRFRNNRNWSSVEEFHGLSIMKVVQKYGDLYTFRINPELN